MGLFTKKKDDDDMEQTSQIKKASSIENKSNKTALPELPMPNAQNPVTDLSENNNSFNNPFSNDLGPSAQSSDDINSPLVSGDDFSDMPGPNNLQVPPAPNMNSQSRPSPSTTMDIVSSQTGVSREEIEEMVDEVVEKVIEERWKEIVDKIEKVVSWKDKQEAHVNMIKEDVVAIRDAFSSLETKLIGKLGSYDKNILDVNSEIKALEKVFQKITPTLVNNINELSKITKELKEDREDKKTNS